MHHEAFLKNHTWTLATLSSSATMIGCKWVFKNKFNTDKSFQRHKVRLVAKGVIQTKCFDCYETFSPLVKSTTIRVILTFFVLSRWPIRQIDIDNVFLKGDLEEKIYMQQPRLSCFRRSFIVHFDHATRVCLCC